MMKKNTKGFSLIEVIISILIFVLIMTAVTMIFVNFIAAYRSAKIIQKDIESAEYAMNLMAKNLRTSTVVSGSGDSTSVKFYNYSDNGKCISYRIQGAKLQAASANDPGDSEPDKKAWCKDRADLSSYSDLTSVSSVYATRLNFYVVSSNGNPKIVGRVTILMEICEDSDCKDKASVQTSVSLRDYQEVGI
ncbi:MAG: prepilin-type N-terminal cleavage/methylation domain-containing protein [bacterium]|nr:prepilin-type N-terminal cleavage/methylation domain-containing protein [bacterium]